MKRTIKVMGEKVTVTFKRPSNEEYNEYSNGIQQAIKDEDDAALITHRVKYFDLWCETDAAKKQLFDRHKSSIMFQVFENVEVSEKN